jgi:hypothetical protein
MDDEILILGDGCWRTGNGGSYAEAFEIPENDEEG